MSNPSPPWLAAHRALTTYPKSFQELKAEISNLNKSFLDAAVELGLLKLENTLYSQTYKGRMTAHLLKTSQQPAYSRAAICIKS